MSTEFIPPHELNFTNFEAHCVPQHVSDVILKEQFDTMRYGSTDLRKLPENIAEPLMKSASDARYVYGEYATKEGSVRNSLFVEENLGGIKLIYETDLGRAKPALLPVTNAYVVLESGACVNLVEELPEGVEIWYTPCGINGYFQDKKVVVSGNRRVSYRESDGLNRPDILTLLHEIGHARDTILNPEAYESPPLPQNLKIQTIKALRNRVRSIRENSETYKQLAETELTKEKNASNFARLWVLAMDDFGCNFVPHKKGADRFCALDRYYATYEAYYNNDLLTENANTVWGSIPQYLDDTVDIDLLISMDKSSTGLTTQARALMSIYGLPKKQEI